MHLYGSSDLGLLSQAGDFLHRQGFVKKEENDGSCTWEFSDLGRERFVLGAYLEHQDKGLHARKGLDLKDMTTFELLWTLQDAGWSFSIPAKVSRKVALAFVGEKPRCVYLSRSAETVLHSYLLALLTYKKHKQPVEPFRTDAYYQHIMTGKIWLSRRPRSPQPPSSNSMLEKRL